jgi:hypothetical protein
VSRACGQVLPSATEAASTSTETTVARSEAKVSEIARPMPLPAPVTTETLPSSVITASSLHSIPANDVFHAQDFYT